MLPDGLAIAQGEAGTEFTRWVHQGLEEPGDLLIQKVHKKERTKARAKRCWWRIRLNLRAREKCLDCERLVRSTLETIPSQSTPEMWPHSVPVSFVRDGSPKNRKAEIQGEAQSPERTRALRMFLPCWPHFLVQACGTYPFIHSVVHVSHRQGLMKHRSLSAKLAGAEG